MSENTGKDGISIDARLLDQYRIYMELQKFYVNEYDELASKNGGLFAFSTLSQSKNELNLLAEIIRERIFSFLKPAKEFLNEDFKSEKAKRFKFEISE